MAKTIPEPAKKKTKTAKSWRTLKPRQFLKSKVNVTNNSLDAEKFLHPAGTVWYVAAVDSSGATILPIHKNMIKIKLQNPNWEVNFLKIKQPLNKKDIDELQKFAEGIEYYAC